MCYVTGDYKLRGAPMLQQPEKTFAADLCLQL